MQRIALIGCGHIGTVHSFALAQLIRAELVDARVTATFDPDAERAERMAGHHGAVACNRLEAALDDADVAWICTWTAGHLRAVEAATARGVAVFCEKPLAPNIADCRTLADTLRGHPHQVGLVLRHAPVFRAFADVVASQKYGRPMTMIFRDDQYFPIQGMYGSTWRSDVALAGGGTLIEHSIHDVDLMQAILGPVKTVRARTAETFGYPGIEDVATLHLDFADGPSAVLASVWHQVTTRPSTRRLELFCEDAMLWTEDDYLGPIHIETSDGHEEVLGSAPTWIDQLTVPEVFAKSLAQYAEPNKGFLDALTSTGEAAVGYPGVDVALRAHEVVDAAYRSAASEGSSIEVFDPPR